MPPARRFRDDVEVKSFPRRAVAVPSVPSALSFFFFCRRRRRRRRHRHTFRALSLSLSLSNTRAATALLLRASSSLESASSSLVLVVVVVFPLAASLCRKSEKSPRRRRVVSFKEEHNVIYPKPYTSIFRVLKSFSLLFLRRKKGRHYYCETKAFVPSLFTPHPPTPRRGGHTSSGGLVVDASVEQQKNERKQNVDTRSSLGALERGEDDDAC